jgi:hypothetical protein
MFDATGFVALGDHRRPAESIIVYRGAPLESNGQLVDANQRERSECDSERSG